MVRCAAAGALWELSPNGFQAKTAISVLRTMLDDENWHVRQAAATALGNIGPEAQAAVPALTALLKDKEEKVQQAAAEALKKIKKEKKQAL